MGETIFAEILPYDHPSSHEEYLLNICSTRGITILSTLMMFPIIYLQDCTKKSMLIVIPSSGVSITKLMMDNHFSSASMAAFCDK
jgi:hypothetical protein